MARGYWKSDEDNAPCKVLKIHDLVTLFPFEGAINRTSLIVVAKTEKTSFPIPCTIWHNPKAGGIDQDATLNELKSMTKQFDMIFIPIEINKPESPWMQITEKAYEGIKKVFGSSPWYKAYEGVNTALNQVYWIKIISETSDGLIITNPRLPGQKKEVRQVEQVVEKDLVYPLIRGRDVKKWYCSGELGYILLPVDSNGITLSHSDLKVKYPKTWEYFSNFFEDLINRGGEPYKSKLEPCRKKKFEIAERSAPPFYWLFNVKPSLALYKVVWKYVAGKISGKAEFSTAVIGGMIPNEKLMLIPFSTEDEAHYVSSVLNSSITQLFVASYVIETAISTHITERIRIPKFDQNNPLHLKLSSLSKKAHTLAKQIYENKQNDLIENLQQIEEEIDKLVSELYGITDEELSAIKKCLKILREGEIEKETEEIPEVPNLEPGVSLENPVIRENEPSKLSIVITNPLSEIISNIRLKVQLPDKKHENLFDKIEKQEICELQLTGLKAGKYELKVSMDYVIGETSKRIEKTLTLFVKSPEEKKTIERGKIEELFG